jgi:hypothetical protein
VTSYVIARTLGDPTASTSHKSSFVTQPLPKSEPQIPNNSDTDESETATVPAAAADPASISIAVLPPEDQTPPSDASTKPITPARATRALGASSLHTFFVDGSGEDDDGAARLAGVGVFSPVGSMPGSPVASRRNILEKESSDDTGSSSEDSGSSAGSVRGRGSVLLRRGERGRDREEVEAEEEGQGGHDGHDDERGHERSPSDGGSGVNGGGSTSGESSFAMLDRDESFEDAGAHIRRRVPGTTGVDE